MALLQKVLTPVSAEIFGFPNIIKNLYVANHGHDANDGRSPLSPKLTLQAAINLVPDFYQYTYIIHIASGAHVDDMQIYDKKGVGSCLLILQGYQNPVANQFSHVPVITSTCTGAGGGGNWPTARPYLLDAGQNFAAYKDGPYVLHITGGTGYNAVDGQEADNWYAIARAADDAGATHLPIVGIWTVATPDATTTYEILPMNLCTFPGNWFIRDSTSVSLRNIGFSVATGGAILVHNPLGSWRASSSFYPSVGLIDKQTSWIGIYTLATAACTTSISIQGYAAFSMVASRIDGLAPNHFWNIGLATDNGRSNVLLRSILISYATYGYWFGPAYAQVSDTLVDHASQFGFYVEGSFVDQSYGIFVDTPTNSGVFVTGSGTRLTFWHNCRVANSAQHGVEVIATGDFRATDITVVITANAGWGINTTVNGTTYGSAANLAGNGAGTHGEATGGQFY